VVFLTPEALLNPDNDGKVLPRPSIGQTPVWYFRADHWAKDHRIFDGLPCGGIMDHRFYRDLLSERVFSGLPSPVEAVCGVIQASGGGDYHSNLIISVHDMAPGRLILDSLRIRENLGKVPAAERLLRNMLNFAAKDRVAGK